ncbi:MAG: GldG family protein [Chloroflexi bacterium]|nr:GldG family protein [Chloroflexota bacterium]
MNRELRERLAPYVLGLMGVALAVAAGAYIVWHQPGPVVTVSLAIAIASLAGYIFLVPDKVRSALTGRQARYGSNALVLTLAFVGILGAVNYLAYQFPKRWDLTEDKAHTLDQVTLDTLAQLPEPVTATAFFSQRMPKDTAQTLLDQYKFASHGKFTYKFVDPEANPALAQQMGITRDGTIVLQMGDRTEKVTSATEKELTAALVRLMHPQQQVVYFLTGHGERSPEDFKEQGYALAKRELVNKNYTVKTLSLLKHTSVPDDANVIVIAGPIKPLSDEEIKAIKAFLDNSGSLFVMLEPPLQPEEAPDPLVNYLQTDWHLQLTPDIIIDPLANPATVVVSYQYDEHPITHDIQTMATIFPTARTVGVPLPVPDGFQMTTLVRSEPKAWGETDLQALLDQQMPKEDDKDIKGPVGVAAALENSKTHARVVVVGDADFASNAYYPAYGNSDFFLNSVDWLSNQEDIIHLNPRTPTQRMMVLPRRDTLGLLLLLFVFVLPGAVLLAGVVVWAQRRRRA